MACDQCASEYWQSAGPQVLDQEAKELEEQTLQKVPEPAYDKLHAALEAFVRQPPGGRLMVAVLAQCPMTVRLGGRRELTCPMWPNPLVKSLGLMGVRALS